MANQLKDRLVQIRKKLKMTQKDMAKKLDISQSNYSKYEKGAVEPSYSFLNKLVFSFNISSAWLLSGEGEMLELQRKEVREDEEPYRTSDTFDVENELLTCKKELIRLRQQNNDLKNQNKELNQEMKNYLKRILDLQDRLIPKKT